jgi:hypothetical protein
MRTPYVVTVEVLLHDKPSVLVKENTVYVFVRAVEYTAHNCVCRGCAKVRLGDVSDRDAVVQAGRCVIAIILR